MRRNQKTALLTILLLAASAGTAAAQNTPTTPTNTDPTTSTDPAATPATGTGTVTVGTPDPSKKDTAAPGPPPEEKKEKKPLKWAGSSFFIQTGMTPDVIIPSMVQSPNPTVETFALLQPRWTFNKDWQLRARATFRVEWTNSDSDNTVRQPNFGDTAFSLFYRGIPKVEKFSILAGVALTLPTSSESRARTVIVQPGLTLQIARPIEKFLGGEALFLASTTYSHPFYTHTTPGYTDNPLYRSDPRSYSPACYGSDTTCIRQVSGRANVSDSLSWFALFSPSWGKWSPAVFFLMNHSFTYTFKDLPGVSRLADNSTTRQSTYFSFWLDYNANAWLTAEIGYQMSRDLIAADGSYGNPFFSTNQQMTAYLGANITLDALYQSLTSSDHSGEGGVVRARKTGPVMQF